MKNWKTLELMGAAIGPWEIFSGYSPCRVAIRLLSLILGLKFSPSKWYNLKIIILQNSSRMKSRRKCWTYKCSWISWHKKSRLKWSSWASTYPTKTTSWWSNLTPLLIPALKIRKRNRNSGISFYWSKSFHASIVCWLVLGLIKNLSIKRTTMTQVSRMNSTISL